MCRPMIAELKSMISAPDKSGYLVVVINNCFSSIHDRILSFEIDFRLVPLILPNNDVDQCLLNQNFLSRQRSRSLTGKSMGLTFRINLSNSIKVIDHLRSVFFPDHKKAIEVILRNRKRTCTHFQIPVFWLFI
jgi:hypothetical protein